MSRNARIAAIVGTLVVLVAAFVAFQPADEETTPTATRTQAATTPAGTTAGPSTTTTPAAAAAAKYTTIVVRDGKPVGGIQKITVTKGDQARIEVTSPDTTDEVHLHGYDLKRDLKAGGNVRFNFTADADGIYEIELEDAGVQIGELVVEPS